MKVITNPDSGAWELAESEEPIARPADSKPYSNRILVVDDEEQTRKLYSTIISQAFPSVECVFAADGARAVEAFAANHPRVILMDIVMPVMDGEEAFYQIEEYCQTNHWQNPRVIFCTGHSPSVGLRNVVASDPADCLLQKPIRKRILITALAKRLNMRPIA